MIKVQAPLANIFFAILFLMFCSCKSKLKHPPGGPYYFRSWASYHIPYQPEQEITADQAKLLNAYYVAYFDGDGKIVSFTKYLYGKFEFGDKYIYNSKGILERRETTKYTGENIIQYWDKSENKLREDTTQTDSTIIIKSINKKGEIFEERIFRKGS